MLFVLELYWGKDKKRKEKERKGKKRKEKKRKGKKRIDPQPKLEKANDGSWKAIMKRK